MGDRRLEEYLHSKRLEDDLNSSSELSLNISALNLKQSPKRKKGLLRFSPKRLISTSTPSSPITPRRSIGSDDLESSSSSLKVSPLKKITSNLKKSSSNEKISEKTSQDKALLCHQCRRKLKIDLFREKFLAVRCPCPEPPCFFCSRECQRIHWISLHEKRDQCFEGKNFPEVGNSCQVPLTWDKPYDQQYQFELEDYVYCPVYHPFYFDKKLI